MANKKIFCKLCKVDVGLEKGDRYFGNNPFPFSKTGRACDWCNDNLVVPIRIRLLTVEQQKRQAQKNG